jgi:polysaccharide deacetylase family protein (PEP-CTERM system associated)
VRRAPFIHATFFILAWIAARLPHLVREIAARGHEVASHGCNHTLSKCMSGQELKRDLIDSKKRLEDTIASPVVGYRAPSFGVDDNMLNTIAECGYRYDSSYNSFSLHGRYGKITLNGQPRAGIAYQLADNFFELPVSNLDMENLVGARCTVQGARRTRQLVLPWGGGAYFRLLPLGVFRRGVRAIIDRAGAYLFYLHPWEIDPEQPRVGQASRAARFKHYTNLEKTLGRLRRVIEAFADCRFVGCGEYVKNGARCTVHGGTGKGSAVPKVS